MSGLSCFVQRIPAGRKPVGIAAVLLPFDSDGRIAEEAFVAHLLATQSAGLANAVNLDAGYVNLLADDEKRRVLEITSQALGSGARFVAGAYTERSDSDPIPAYRGEIERILAFGGTPILFQTKRLHGRTAREKVEAYR